MELNASRKKPDWEYIDNAQHNFFQKWASKTNGIITPGNVASIMGFSLVHSGFRDLRNKNRPKALIKIFSGKLLSAVDGTISDLTGTKSPKGRVLNAVVEKCEIVEALASSALINKEIPFFPALVMTIQNTSNSLCETLAHRWGAEIRPTEEHRLANVAQWAAIGGFVASKHFEENDHMLASKLSRGLGYFMIGADFEVGSLSSIYTIGDSLGPRTAKK